MTLSNDNLNEAVVNTETISESAHKLLCGKYKNIEELEKGYGEQQKYIDTLRNDIKHKEMLLSENSPPERYIIPEGVPPDNLKDFINLAKNNNLNQKQFENFVLNIKENDKKALAALDVKKKELGDNYDKIKHYVELNYGNNEVLQNVIVNAALHNKDVADKILERREKLLNSTLPQSSPSINKKSAETLHEDFNKAYGDYLKSQSSSDKAKVQSILTELEAHPPY